MLARHIGLAVGIGALATVPASSLTAQRARAATPRPASRPAAPLAAADAAYASGDTARAAREYERVLATDPENGRALYRLAMLRRARPAEADRLLRRYVAVEPRDAWGHIALGDVLARRGRVDEALAAYDAAARLAPGERDVAVGRARLLAGAGRLDASAEAYNGWLARRPLDAEAWTELAHVRRRAGQSRAALAAAERAHALSSSPRSASLVRGLREAVAPAVEVRGAGTTDSDATRTVRGAVVIALPELGRERVSVGAGWKSIGAAGASTARVADAQVLATFRPRATTRVELAGGVAWRQADSVAMTIRTTHIPGGPRGPGRGGGMGGGGTVVVDTLLTRSAGSATTPFARARLNWRAPSDAVRLDLRAARQLLDANPILVRDGAVRDEASAELDLRLAGPVRVRGFGRAGAVRAGDQTNGRQLFGGALLAAAPAGPELALRAQRLQYDAPSRSGYFAPRAVELAELGGYAELESATGVLLALDLGAGAQRVTPFDGVAGAWSPALRGWTQLLVPLGRGNTVGVELDMYSSQSGADAVTASAGAWRYGSLSVWLRRSLP